MHSRQRLSPSELALHRTQEASYNDTTLIMQLLHDNLTLWSSDKEGGAEPCGLLRAFYGFHRDP